MNRDRLCFAGACIALALAAGVTQAGEILYETDFESGPLGTEWSSNSTLASEGIFTRFNGRYTNNSTILTLGAVPHDDGDCGGGDGGGGGSGGGSHGGSSGGADGGAGGGRCGSVVYTTEFDLHIIDSWDGDYESYGPDRFEVRLGSSASAPETLFSETFATGHPWQSYRAPDIGNAHLGFSAAWQDAIYRDVSVSFELPADAETFSLTFIGVGLQSLGDESWGIDNVSVNYSVVPAPASLSACGLVLLFGSHRRKR